MNGKLLRPLLAAALSPAFALVAAGPADPGEEPTAQTPAPSPASRPVPGKPARKKASKEERNKVPEATVEVTGNKGPDEGYRVETVNAMGPLGTERVLDIPHTVLILPASLIENVQATNLKETLKYAPLAQFQEMQGSEVLRPATRGMQGSNYQNTRMDGMTVFITGANAMEMLQQVEILSGVPAAVFGPANPSGTFNLVTKRSTSERTGHFTAGYDSENIFTAHADLGGKFDDEGVVGYRLNVLDGHGNSYVSGSQLDRKLFSLGIDVRPDRDTSLEFNVSNYDLVQKGFPGWFTYGEKTLLPKAPDPTKAGYGQPYAGVDLTNQVLSGKLNRNLGSTWVLTAGVLWQSVDRNINTPVNAITDNQGDYTTSLASGLAPHFGIFSNVAYLNGHFNTGDLTHDLTVGTTGFRATTKSPLVAPAASAVLLGKASFDDPRFYAPPVAGLPDVMDQYQSSVNTQQGMNVSDLIGFAPRWSLKLALSQDWMETFNYNKSNVQTTTYNKNGLSPMPSLIFKPQDNVTTYLTYASSLQQGDIAPAGAANANTALAPYRSTQWELGAKWTLGGLDLGGALFRLERPFAWTDPSDNTFKIQGNQVNKGVELTAVGKVVESLRIVSGVTYLDSTMENTGNPLTNDQKYVGLPKLKTNLLVEYWVQHVPGLVFTADWQYTDKRPANDSNTVWVGSYNVVDLGARYTTRAYGLPTTWRLMLDNLTDTHYYSTIAPSNITGSNTGNLIAHLGMPRTVSASVSVNF